MQGGHPQRAGAGSGRESGLATNGERAGRAYFFFLLRSATTVVMLGITAPAEMGLAGEASFLGFFASLLLFC